MRTLFLFVLLLLAQFLFSQDLPAVWQGCFGGSEPDKANDIIELEDGYLIVGVARSDDGDVSFNHGGDDGWLIKTNFEGNLLWEKTFGGSNGDGFSRIFPTGDGNYYLIGGSSSSDGDITNDPYPSSMDYWIVKIDGIGNILWDKIVGGNMLEQIWTGTATSDGGVVALGWTGSNDGDISNWYGLYDTWMVKLNSEGEIVADMSFGTSGFDFGQALIETSDGGFLVGSNSIIQSGGNIDCDPNGIENGDAVLFKLDSDLNIEWQMCYGGSSHDGITGLLEHEDGYVFVAYTTSDDGDVTGLHGPPDEAADNWVVSIDFDGNIIWEKCFGGTLYEFASKLFSTSNGFMVVGQSESHNGDVEGNHSQSEYSSDIWLMEVSGDGELLWQQCIGGLGNEELRFGAIKKSDTDFVIAGQFDEGPSFDVGCTPFGVFADMPDVWIFEVKDTTTTVTNNESIITNKLKVYPNPARDYVVFELNEYLANGKIHIVNVFGQEVTMIPTKQEKNVWDTRDIKSGIYYFSIGIKSTVHNGKIIISK